MDWSWAELGKRPLVFPVVGWVVGTIIAEQTIRTPWVFLLAATGLFGVAAVLRHRTGAWLLVLIGCAFAGVATARWQRDAELSKPLVLKANAQLEGVVTAIAPTEHGSRIELDVARIDGRPARARVLLSATGELFWVTGQRVLVDAKLKPLSEPMNPGEPDFATRSRRRGVIAVGSFDAKRGVALSAPSEVRAWLRDLSRAFPDFVALFAERPAAAALFVTLGMGLRTTLDDETESDFARSGLAHILSVSGLHVAVIALAMYAALSWVLVRVALRAWRRLNVKRIAAALSIPWVWGFVMLTGVQAPAVRSGVMASVVFISISLERRADALNALALAAMVMLCADPSCLYDISVQLSFTAVAAIVLVSPRVREVLPVPHPSPATQDGWSLRLARVRESIVQTLAGSLAVSIATAPLVMALFQQTSVAGLVSNIVILPLSGVLTLCSAIGATLFLIAPMLAVPCVALGVGLSDWVVTIAHWFSSVPFAVAKAPALPIALAVPWLLGLALFTFSQGRWRWAGVLTPCALAIHVWGAHPDESAASVTFLAVGQGDSVLISSNGHHALIDGGGAPHGADTGKRYVLPLLRSRRVDQLDLTVLTHAHPDHALGLVSVLEQVPTARLWFSAGSEAGRLTDAVQNASGGAATEWIERGHAPVKLGAVTLDVLGPPTDRVLLEGENDRSIVLLARHGEVTFLLTGDVEEAGEEHLSPGEVTVMKAPHHGSSTSSSASLVERTRPRFVVFCVGRYNRFGFPEEEVVERYERIGSRCYRTDRHGAITFRSDGHSVRVETFRTGAVPAPAHWRSEEVNDETAPWADETSDDTLAQTDEPH